MTIRVRVLGPVALDGADAAALSPKVRTVLAMLVAHRGSVVSVDRLCEALWGDEPPDAATTTLQSHVSRLRRLLADAGSITVADGGYRLQLPVGAVDVDEFSERTSLASTAEPRAAVGLLTEALELWRGPAFGELAELPWIRPEAVRLDELRLAALETSYDGRLAVGGDTALISDLERATLSHPDRECFVRQLMLALARTGRHAEALRRAHDFRRFVRDEVGVDPSNALDALEARILADDPTLAGAPPTASVRRPPPVVDDPSRLVGRDVELSSIGRAIDDLPLVTLLGPGGVGKTRLARRVASTSEGFTHGVAFVELAAVSDDGSLPDAVATALDVQPHQHRTIDETLLAVLAEQHRLVVFDNCEHLLDSLVPFVDRIRARCPRVHLLVTSREPLGLPGEHVVAVAPLPVVASDVTDPAVIAASPAVELLLDRVAAAVPGFEVTTANAPTIGEICRRLDGLPLALELVAARFRSLSPDTILTRVTVPTTVLSTSMRSSAQRHRTLRDTIAWSYELLGAQEQLVYERLSAFTGSFDLDAAEALCAPVDEAPGTTVVDDVVGLLVALVDKSMVQMVAHQDGRYQLLETLREFGREKLAERGETDQVGAAHLRWFLGIAEQASVGLTGPDEASWSRRLEWDFDNLRLAFGHAVRTDDVDAALRLTAALREFAFRRIRYELTAWAATALAMKGAHEHPRAPVVLAMVAYGHFVRGSVGQSIEVARRAVDLGERRGTGTSGLAERTLLNALFYRGDSDESLAWGDRMVASARSGSPARLAHALYMRSVAETSIGGTVQGAIMAGEASAVARSSGSPTALAQASYALGLALEGSDAAESLRLLRESARLAAAAGNRWIEAFAGTEVWWMEARNGDVLTALRGSGVVVDTWDRGGDWANLRLSLRRVFALLVRLGDHRSAAVLYAALRASGAISALPFEPHDAQDATESVAELRLALGDQEFDAAVAAGTALSETELVTFVQGRIATHTRT